MKKNVCIISIIAAAILAAGCSKKNAEIQSAQIPAEVKVSKPLVRDLEIWSTHASKISASENVEIRARVGGYLDSVNFKKGQYVKKGDLLFKIDSRPYKIAVDAAKSNVKALESKIKLAADNARRAEGLHAKNAISEELYQTRITELLVTQAKLLEAKSALDNAVLNLEYCEVRAPSDGRISENFVDCGNLIAPNVVPLARLVKSDIVKIYFDIGEQDALRFRNLGILSDIQKDKGAKVKVQQKNDSRIKEGKLSYYDNQIGRSTASLVMCADIDNSDDTLMVGALAETSVLERVAKNAVLLPEEAIGTDLAGRYVLVVGEGDIVKYVPVKVGELRGKFRIINEGVKTQDRVVVSGLQRAAPGRKVIPESAEISK